MTKRSRIITVVVGLSLALAWVVAPSALAAEAARPAALGAWDIKITTPTGTQRPVLFFARDGKKFKGLMVGDGGKVSLKSVRLEGNTFAFKQRTTLPLIGEITLNFSGEVDGRKMTGVVKTPQGEESFTGKRKMKKKKK